VLSLVIPVHNEVNAIESTLRRAKASKTVKEIVVVDDGSTDGTNAILEAAQGIKLIKNQCCMGYGRSLKIGAAASIYPSICICDADGTYPLEDIDKLFEEYSRHGSVEMVIGARKGQNVSVPLERRPAKFVLTSYASLVAGKRIEDLNSGLRIFSRGLFEKFEDDLSEKFSFTSSLTMCAMMCNEQVSFVPIDYSKRIGKSKINPIRDTKNFFQVVNRLGWKYNFMHVLKVYTVALLGLLSLAALAVSGVFS
jgi:glycosyltransferase involved in cell wall biosynthesis